MFGHTIDAFGQTHVAFPQTFDMYLDSQPTPSNSRATIIDALVNLECTDMNSGFICGKRLSSSRIHSLQMKRVGTASNTTNTLS